MCNEEKKKAGRKDTVTLVVLFIVCVLCTVLGLALGTAATIWADDSKNYYSDVTKVVTVDKKNDTVVIENYAGFRYAFTGVEDWQIDDYASVIMDSNGTENIYDDKIVSVRYEKIF